MIKRLPLLPLLLLASPVSAQLAYESMSQGIKYKVFIYSKEYIGGSAWSFQTKTIFNNGEKPRYGDKRVADCQNSTIDGKVVKAIPAYRYEEGESNVLLAACGRSIRRQYLYIR
jgi:hypothetical protein